MTETQVPHPSPRSQSIKATTLKRVGILIATYQEAQNIARLISDLEELPFDSEILVVDDSSPDGTSEIVRSLQGENPNLFLHQRPSKLGLGTAILDGFRLFLDMEEPPDLIVTIDADYSHDPKSVGRLIVAMVKGCGVVVGSRYCEGGRIVGWPVARRVISRGANLLAASLLGVGVRDCTSGFRCYSAEFLLEALGSLKSRDYEIEVETLMQARRRGYGVVEAPITFVDRRAGRSKFSLGDAVSYASYLLRNL